SLEGFYKQLDNLVTTRAGNSGKGRAFGLETLLRYKPDDRFFGWLAYTLSRSVRRDTPSEPERLARFDETHILTVLGSYRLARGRRAVWGRAGGRGRLPASSRQAYTRRTRTAFTTRARPRTCRSSPTPISGSACPSSTSSTCASTRHGSFESGSSASTSTCRT